MNIIHGHLSPKTEHQLKSKSINSIDLMYKKCIDISYDKLDDVFINKTNNRIDVSLI